MKGRHRVWTCKGIWISGGISKYRLAQISGVPNTTIVDICAGRSEIGRCAAKTVQQLAKALDCTMEDIMELSPAYESDTGLPTDKSYLECGLPDFCWNP